MLYDRHYMKEAQRPQKKSLRSLTAVQTLLLANVAVFILGLFLFSFFGSTWLQETFRISLHALKSGRIWTLVSYAFLHGNFLHILLNMLVLYFIGPHVEKRIGMKRFYAVYFAAVVAGAIFWIFSDLITGSAGYLVGASAGVVGIFTAFCMLEADRKMTFLLFFIIPITVRPRILLAFMAGFELFNFLFNEIAPFAPAGGIGYSSHLGGIAAGLVASLIINGRIRLPFLSKFSKKYKGSAEDYSFRVNIMTDAELKAEVNRILDKINTRGFSALSDREKDILSIAKDRLK